MALHQRCVGCEENNPYGGRERLGFPAHRYRPGTPAPQGVGAVAAIERDDRAATPERVPRCHPGGTGNKTCRTVQVGGDVRHTWRTGAGVRAGSLPQRTAAAAHVPLNRWVPRTCSCSAEIGGAIAVAQDIGSPFTRYRGRRDGRRIRYRSVSRGRGHRWHERSRGQSCEARCQTRQRHGPHGCGHDCGRACGCRCAAKPSPARIEVQGRRARRTPSRVRREAPTRALRKCSGQCGAVRTTAPDRGGKEERAAPLDDDATRDALWPMRRPGAPGYRAGGLCPQGCR